jgi:hypothetical protein
MTKWPRVGNLGVAAGAANAGPVARRAASRTPSAAAPRRMRRRLMRDVSSIVPILPVVSFPGQLFNTLG